jgi:S1-C subfamily serine protease
MLREGSARVAALSFVCAGLGAACSSPPPSAWVSPKPPVVKPVVAVVAPPGHAARANVEHALSAGPPWLIRRVLHEPVVDKAGHFQGWRITGVPEEWSDVDLRPGDVVSKVNNHPLETPDDAWEAWKSVGRAREIRVRIERAGVSREVVVPIDGDPSAAVVRALESDTPPPRPAPTSKPKTVTSLGTDATPEESNDWESY